MTVKKIYIITIVSILVVITPVLYLLRILDDEVAFPIMFTMLGIQQVTVGLLSENERGKITKKLFVIFGVLFILFGLGIVLPYYCFVT